MARAHYQMVAILPYLRFRGSRNPMRRLRRRELTHTAEGDWRYAPMGESPSGVDLRRKLMYTEEIAHLSLELGREWGFKDRFAHVGAGQMRRPIRPQVVQKLEIPTRYPSAHHSMKTTLRPGILSARFARHASSGAKSQRRRPISRCWPFCRACISGNLKDPHP